MTSFGGILGSEGFGFDTSDLAAHFLVFQFGRFGMLYIMF